MFIKIDENKKIVEATTDKKEGYIEFTGEINYDKFMFARFIDGQIVYDEQAYNEFLNKQNERMNSEKEIFEIENWFVEYDRICSEHARCQRLGVECHHNIEEWDTLAVQKAERLKELRNNSI